MSPTMSGMIRKSPEPRAEPLRVLIYIALMVLTISAAWIILALIVGWGVRDLWHIPAPI